MLEDFLRSTESNEVMGDLSEGLEARREDLVCPDPSRCFPKTAEDRAALQSGSVVVKGFRAKVAIGWSGEGVGEWGGIGGVGLCGGRNLGGFLFSAAVYLFGDIYLDIRERGKVTFQC